MSLKGKNDNSFEQLLWKNQVYRFQSILSCDKINEECHNVLINFPVVIIIIPFKHAQK